eukprot:jgi/Botrbrau1/10088/Bobra.0355s0041.2
MARLKETLYRRTASSSHEGSSAGLRSDSQIDDADISGQPNDTTAEGEFQEDGTAVAQRDTPQCDTTDPATAAASITWRQHLNEQILYPVFQFVKATVPAETFRTFRMRVNKAVVKDYQTWVKFEDEMWLDKIARKIQQMDYTTGGQFRGDFEKIYINAQAYNTEGHGELSTPSLIGEALHMLEQCDVQLERYADNLKEAEPEVAKEVAAAYARADSIQRENSDPSSLSRNLPPGVELHIVTSESKPSGYGQYKFLCPLHGEKRADRIRKVAELFNHHASCWSHGPTDSGNPRPAELMDPWGSWARKPSETDDEHVERLRPLFLFSREKLASGPFTPTAVDADPAARSEPRAAQPAASSRAIPPLPIRAAKSESAVQAVAYTVTGAIPLPLPPPALPPAGTPGRTTGSNSRAATGQTETDEQIQRLVEKCQYNLLQKVAAASFPQNIIDYVRTWEISFKSGSHYKYHSPLGKILPSQDGVVVHLQELADKGRLPLDIVIGPGRNVLFSKGGGNASYVWVPFDGQEEVRPTVGQAIPLGAFEVQNPAPVPAELIEADVGPSLSEPLTTNPVSNEELNNKGKNARCRVELSPHVMTLIRGPLAEAVKNLSGASYVSDGAALQVALGFAWRLEKGAALVCGPSQSKTKWSAQPREWHPVLADSPMATLDEEALLREFPDIVFPTPAPPAKRRRDAIEEDLSRKRQRFDNGQIAPQGLLGMLRDAEERRQLMDQALHPVKLELEDMRQLLADAQTAVSKSQERCQNLEEEANAARTEAAMERAARELESQRAAAEVQSAFSKFRRETHEQASQMESALRYAQENEEKLLAEKEELLREVERLHQTAKAPSLSQESSVVAAVAEKTPLTETPGGAGESRQREGCQDQVSDRATGAQKHSGYRRPGTCQRQEHTSEWNLGT